MPGITVQGPPIPDIDKRRVLVKELCESAAKAYGFPIEKIHVLIKENPPENVGVGGVLVLDRKKEE